MKRVFFSLFLSFSLLILWLTLSAILEFYFLAYETVEKLAIPFRLPAYLYLYVLKLHIPQSEAQSILLGLTAFLFNILLYGLIFYLLITLFPRL